MKKHLICLIIISLLFVLLCGCRRDPDKVYASLLTEYRSLREDLLSGEINVHSEEALKEYLAEHYPDITDINLLFWLELSGVSSGSYAGSMQGGVYYAYYDVNKDGTPELFISCEGEYVIGTEDGSELTNRVEYLRQVYTCAKDKVIPLFDDTLALYDYSIMVLEESLVYRISTMPTVSGEQYIAEYELSRDGILTEAERFKWDNIKINPEAISEKRSILLNELMKEYQSREVKLSWQKL